MINPEFVFNGFQTPKILWSLHFFYLIVERLLNLIKYFFEIIDVKYQYQNGSRYQSNSSPLKVTFRAVSSFLFGYFFTVIAFPTLAILLIFMSPETFCSASSIFSVF